MRSSGIPSRRIARDAALTRCRRAGAALLLALAGGAPAMAQPAEQAEPGKGISERTLREAEGPMRWIKLHSETVRKSEESRKAAAATSATPPAVRPTAAANTRPTERVVAADKAPAARTAANGAAAPAASRAQELAARSPDESVDTASLVAIDHVEPEWDDEVLRRLRKGRVVVRFQVAQDGYLSRIQIVESTNSRLTGPAMAAVMQWRFAPIPEPCVATAEFGFDIDGEAARR